MKSFLSKEDQAMDGFVKEMMTDSFEKYGKERCIEATKLSKSMGFADVAKTLNVSLSDATNMILAGAKFEVDDLLKGFNYNRDKYKDCQKAGCDGKIALVRGDGAYLCDKCQTVYRKKTQ